jgi:hypothetical protein
MSEADYDRYAEAYKILDVHEDKSHSWRLMNDKISTQRVRNPEPFGSFSGVTAAHRAAH